IAAKALPFMGQRVMYDGKVKGIHYPAILAMPFDRTGENWGAAERLCRSACLLKPGILWYVSPLADNSEVFRHSKGIMTLESTRHLPRGHTLFTFTRKR